jgi:hypothetical protein
MGHFEQLTHLEVAVKLAEELVEPAPRSFAGYWSTRPRKPVDIET